MTRAILHLLNDQPLAVELVEEPKPGDVAIICTNLRTIDGKRPVFIDFSNSRFVIPMAAVRFVEIPTGLEETDRAAAVAAASESSDESEDLEIDEDFLRRVREA